MKGNQLHNCCTLLSAVFLLFLNYTAAQNIEREITPPLKEPQAITFKELSSALENFTVVDIRRRDEIIEFGQIPGSHILPLQELTQALSLNEKDFSSKYGFPKIKKDDASVVLTCRSGRRVQVANELLVELGYTNHRLYLGSYLDWVKNGGELIKPGRPFEPKNSTVTETTPSDFVPVTPDAEADSANSGSNIPREFIIF